MDTLTAFIVILFLLMIVVGGRKGLVSFLMLFVNFVIVIVAVLLMTDRQANPLIIAIIACTIISYTTLFLVNGNTKKTKVAFISTLITTLLLVGVIQIIVNWTAVGGFSTEAIDELTIYQFYFGIDFAKITSSVILMSTIGAVTDEAISVASPMYELHRHAPNQSRRDLFNRGMEVGYDLLATSANTLFFAFFGSYLALFVRFYDLNYQFSELFNAKVFAAEWVLIFLSGIGIVLIIPVTAFLTAHFLTRQSKELLITKKE